MTLQPGKWPGGVHKTLSPDEPSWMNLRVYTLDPRSIRECRFEDERSNEVLAEGSRFVHAPTTHDKPESSVSVPRF